MRIYCPEPRSVQTTSSAYSIKLIAHVRIKERVFAISPPGTAPPVDPLNDPYLNVLALREQMHMV